MKKVFAYGSNMDAGQMRSRCPSARVIGPALLENHRFAFGRWSDKRESAVADAVASPGDTVWGVIWEITENDYRKLLKKEGVGKGYYEARERTVKRPTADGFKEEVVVVLTVTPAERTRFAGQDLRPSAEYMAFVINGARQHNLPEPYITDVLGRFQVGV